MSADNWDVCPVCLERATIHAVGPVDKYNYRTFREDYEFFLKDMSVEVRYSGRCTVCSSGVSIKDSRPIEINLS